MGSAYSSVAVAVAATLLSVFCAASAAESQPSSEPAFVDRFDYTDDAAARAAWKPMAGSAEVRVVAEPGAAKATELPCNFAGTSIERASWDRQVSLDLADAGGLQFEVACDDDAPISHMRLYLHAGEGWYSAGFSVASKQLRQVTIDKHRTSIEGKPAGWAKIDTIRISAWRGGDTDTTIRIRNLRVVPAEGSVVIVRAESTAANLQAEIESACRYTQSVAARLNELGLAFRMVSDLDVTGDSLAGAKLIVLPFNPSMSDAAADAIAAHLKRGGRMLAFFALPPKLEEAVGIRTGRYIAASQPGQFSSIRPAKDAAANVLPPVVRQSSWGLREGKSIGDRAKVLAEWHDRDGKPAGQPAILASDNCVLMTHVLLDDNLAGKRQLLLAMMNQAYPSLGRAAAMGISMRALNVGPFAAHVFVNADDLGPVVQALAKAGNKQAVDMIADSVKARDDAITASQAGHLVRCLELASEARAKITRALCAMETPHAPEHRAFWCHSAFGVDGMDWEASIKMLADNGFTAIIPNMLWGGAAYYEGGVLPAATDLRDRGDQIKLCLAACRKYGVQCHVWKVNFNMGWNAPKDFTERMKRDGRTQVGFDGKPIDRWLCPSNPDNQKLEIDSMIEVGTKYEVDGIHFDYIRYPGREGCFCDGCRGRFEKLVGRKVDKWPADVRQPPLREKWLDFRRGNITRVVAAVSERARKARPKVKVSAAVFPNWTSARNEIGQDWKLWCEKGYLDFVCPMDYTADSDEFANMVARQVKWAGKVPCYPGIGLSCWGSDGDIFTLIRQIKAARAAGTGCFTIFNYGPTEAAETLPLCGEGITRPAAR